MTFSLPNERSNHRSWHLFITGENMARPFNKPNRLNLNLRLAKSVGTYYKLEHLLTPEDVQKMIFELEQLHEFLLLAEIEEKSEDYAE
tara:strand:+ start:861 stop:1124 length:264 start_codon:yes stop_codon:yes gene_type:complete